MGSLPKQTPCECQRKKKWPLHFLFACSSSFSRGSQAVLLKTVSIVERTKVSVSLSTEVFWDYVGWAPTLYISAGTSTALKGNGWAPVGLREEGDTLANCLRPGSYKEITLWNPVSSCCNPPSLAFLQHFMPVFVSEYNFSASNLCENCLINEQTQAWMSAAH